MALYDNTRCWFPSTYITKHTILYDKKKNTRGHKIQRSLLSIPPNLLPFMAPKLFTYNFIDFTCWTLFGLCIVPIRAKSRVCNKHIPPLPLHPILQCRTLIHEKLTNFYTEIPILLNDSTPSDTFHCYIDKCSLFFVGGWGLFLRFICEFHM